MANEFNLYLGIEGQLHQVTTKQDVVTELIFSNGSLGELNDKRANYSKTIQVVRDKRANEIFNYAYDVSSLIQRKNIKAVIESGGVQIMEGSARLLSANDKTFEIAVYSGVLPEFETKDLKLNELDWSGFESFNFNENSIKFRIHGANDIVGLDNSRLLRAFPMSTYTKDISGPFDTLQLNDKFDNITAGINLHEAVKNCLRQIYPSYHVQDDITNLTDDPRTYLNIALPLKKTVVKALLNPVQFEDTEDANTYRSNVRMNNGDTRHMAGGLWSIPLTGFQYVDTTTETTWDKPIKRFRFLGESSNYINIAVHMLIALRFDERGVFKVGFNIHDHTKNTNVGFKYATNQIDGTITEGTIDFSNLSFVKGNIYSFNWLVSATSLYDRGPNDFRVSAGGTIFQVTETDATKIKDSLFDIRSYMPNKPAMSLVKDYLKLTNSKIDIFENTLKIIYDKDKLTDAGVIRTDFKEVYGVRKVKYSDVAIKSLEVNFQKATDLTTKNNYPNGFGYYKTIFGEHGKEQKITFDTLAIGTFTNLFVDRKLNYTALDMREQTDELLRLFYITPTNIYQSSPNAFMGVLAPYTAPFFCRGDKFWTIGFDPQGVSSTFDTPRMDKPPLTNSNNTYQFNSVNFYTHYYAEFISSINSDTAKAVDTEFLMTPQQFASISQTDKIIIEGVVLEVDQYTYNIDKNICKVKARTMPPSSYVQEFPIISVPLPIFYNTIRAIDASINKFDEWKPARESSPFAFVDCDNAPGQILNKETKIDANV